MKSLRRQVQVSTIRGDRTTIIDVEEEDKQQTADAQSREIEEERKSEYGEGIMAARVNHALMLPSQNRWKNGPNVISNVL